MFFSKWRIALSAAAILFSFTLLGRAADDAGLEGLPNGTYIHKDSKTALKVPVDWKIIAPYRLRRTTSSSILGLEKADPRVNITIVWSRISNWPFREVTPTGENASLADAQATLVTVYSKEKVGQPSVMKVGTFNVFKILIDDGPDRDGRYAGAFYLFETGTGDDRWKVRIRADFPALNREEYIKQVEDVIKQFVVEE
ncbi:MAG: hypothetical protein K8T89_18700 [Planctomycetes bacterium]|nr:hypothetical protein [Planctomycetota bacterium]